MTSRDESGHVIAYASAPAKARRRLRPTLRLVVWVLTALVAAILLTVLWIAEAFSRGWIV